MAGALPAGVYRPPPPPIPFGPPLSSKGGQITLVLHVLCWKPSTCLYTSRVCTSHSQYSLPATLNLRCRPPALLVYLKNPFKKNPKMLSKPQNLTPNYHLKSSSSYPKFKKSSESGDFEFSRYRPQLLQNIKPIRKLFCTFSPI